MELEEVVARVWPGLVATAEPLGGGLTNHNFRVEVAGESFVLRVGGKDTALLGIDRRAEHAASVQAAELGIGPEVVAFVEPEGYLVTRFLGGRPIPPDEMRRPATIARAAAALRRLHDSPPLACRFDAFEVVDAYRATAAARGVPEPAEFAWARALAERIRALRCDAPPVPCHNDLLNANFLLVEGEVQIVDWEYAGVGDRFFDLANFAVNHGLDEGGDRALLRAYFGAEREDDLGALTLMRFMSDFREAMWGVVQRGISELDVDFAAYAAEHFERLRATADTPGFRSALG